MMPSSGPFGVTIALVKTRALIVAVLGSVVFAVSALTAPVTASADPKCTQLIDYAGDPRSMAEINGIGYSTGTCPAPIKGGGIAQPLSSAEADFIANLNKWGAEYPSVPLAIQIGYGICTELRKGLPVGDVVQMARTSLSQLLGGVKQGTTGHYLAASAKFFCPDQRNRTRDWSNLPPLG